jgi:hypothetical protein
MMDAAKQKLEKLYPIRNLGPITHHLGLSIVRDRKIRTIYFTQTTIIDRIFEKVDIMQCTPCATLMEPGM